MGSIIYHGGMPSSVANVSTQLIPLDGMVSAWLLNEGDPGPYVDSHGSNDLGKIGGNGPTAGIGPTGKSCADFQSPASAIAIADNATLSLNDTDWTISVWWRSANTSGTHYLFSKFNGSLTEFRVYTVDAAIYCRSSADGSANKTVGGDTWSINTWNQFVVRYDLATGTLSGVFNDGTPTTATGMANTYNGTADCVVGAYQGGASPYDDLLADPVIVKRYWTDAEVTASYNLGSGLQYPFTG